MKLEFPVSRGRSRNVGFGVATFDRATRSWVPVPARVDADRTMVVAQIQHFSWWNPFSWDWTSIGARVNQRVGQIVGKRAPSATCTRGQSVPDWVSTLAGISNEPAIALRACAEGEGDVLAIEISNNRPYSMYLRFGSPVKWAWHEAGDSAQDRARNALADRFAGPGELYIPPLSRASVGIYKTTGYKAFAAGAGWRSLAVDVLDNLLGSAVGKIPGAGTCLKGLFAQQFGSFSPGKVRDGVKELLVCVTKEAAALGYFDKATISQLEAISHKLGFVGVILTLGDVEWKLLDLYVDNFVVADTGLGAGFSFLGRQARPSPAAQDVTTIRADGIGSITLGMDQALAIERGQLTDRNEDSCTVEIDSTTDDVDYAMPAPSGNTVRVFFRDGQVSSFYVKGRWTSWTGVQSGMSSDAAIDRLTSAGYQMTITDESDPFGAGRIDAFRDTTEIMYGPPEASGVMTTVGLPAYSFCD